MAPADSGGAALARLPRHHLTVDNHGQPTRTLEVEESAQLRPALAQLTANPLNFRRHPERQRQALAGALGEIGWVQRVVVNEVTGHLIDGHARVELAAARNESVPVQYVKLTPEEERLALATLDPIAAMADTDAEVLGQLLTSITAQDAGVTALLRGLAEDHGLQVAGLTRGRGDPEQLPPEIPRTPTTRPGDLWELGGHRLLCGDTTIEDQVARVTLGEAVALVHADPPYGMGKEKDGIANDNLYDAKLDAFQLRWWQAWAPVLAPNASAYVWGQAPDLWRLWWRTLEALGGWTVRNEIVWNKGAVPGMASEEGHSYRPGTERCLFLMRGQQFLGNQNKADYWQGYEPLRAWLEAQRKQAGWTNGAVNKLTGTSMAGHWFTQSQFIPISREHYEALQQHAGGRAFCEPYDELFGRLFPEVKGGGNAHRRQLSEALRSTRSYFDNAHDAMTDVWEFPRVIGAERFGHARPKPVAMMQRAIKTSTAPGALVAAPFGGTGPELIACEVLDRRCALVELEPAYCDVMVQRWQTFTGRAATLASDGRTFAQLAQERGA